MQRVEKKEEKEDDAFLAEERKKLKEKLEEHKRKVSRRIAGCLCLEVLLASIYMKLSSNPLSLANVFNVYHDTLDCALLIALRLLSLYFFTRLAIKVGDYKTYQQQNNSNSKHQFVTTVQAQIMSLVFSAWRYLFINSLSKVRDENANNISSSSPPPNSDSRIHSTFSLQKLVDKYSKIDPMDLADFWKSTVWLIVFSFISVFQAYISIKCVFFVSTSLPSHYLVHGLFALTVLLCHFEMYCIRQYIDDCTEPDNKFFDANIHSHPVFLRSVIGNWCDICWKRIEKACYRCDKCDYDVCHKCWKNEKNAQKLAAHKDEQTARGDVTGYEYFRRLFKLYRTHWITLAVALMTVFCTSLISVYLPSSRGQLFDDIFQVNLDAFYHGLKLFILWTFIQGVLSAVHNVLQQRVEEQIMNEVQQSLYERILKQDMSYFDNTTSSVLVERLDYGLNDAISPFLELSQSAIKDTIALVGSFYFCCLYSHRLLLLALSTLAPMAYLSTLFRAWHNSNMHTVWYFDSDLYRFASESFANIRTVRSYSKETSMLGHYQNIRNELHNRKMKGALMSALNSTLNAWLDLIASTLIIWAGGILVFQHLQHLNNNDNNNGNEFAIDVLTVGELITFERYWNKLKHTIFALQRSWARFDRACFMAKHIFRLLDATPTIEYLGHGQEHNNDNNNTQKRIQVTDIDGDIVFEDVRFSYITEPNKQVLKGIDLVIPKGKITAFVGRSGGGKTTLINLLVRFYDPTHGNIRINGVDIREMDVYSLRNQIAMVSQSTQLFKDSIAHNIAFGVDTYCMPEIRKCSKLANAHDFIMKFEDGYECQIGDDGSKLSGGQKQRVSIARMLMKRPKLMLLDEATSSLDAESEALVQAALDIAIKEQQSTVVVVAHRLSTVVNADQIVVIDDGKVIESGNHCQLIERNGLYAKLVERQLNLQHKMKHKATQIQSGGGGGDANAMQKEKEKETETDADNIDQLIEQIRNENQIKIGHNT